MAATATERKLFVGGEWVETGDWIDVRSPYSGEVVGRVAKGGADETRRAIDAAERALESAAAGAQARRDPRQGRRLPRPPPRRGRADDLRGGRQADEGGARRGAAGDVDLHLRRGRGADARRRDGPDGRVAGRRGKARVHAPRADRRRRRDLAVQLPAQPRRAQDRARARGGVPGRAQAGDADAALGAAARGAGGRGRPAAGLAQRRRRARRRRSATSSSRTSACG